MNNLNLNRLLDEPKYKMNEAFKVEGRTYVITEIISYASCNDSWLLTLYPDTPYFYFLTYEKVHGESSGSMWLECDAKTLPQQYLERLEYVT